MQNESALRLLLLLLDHEKQWYEKRRSNPYIGVGEISEEFGLSEAEALMLGDSLARKGWILEDSGIRGLYSITEEGRNQAGVAENYLVSQGAPTSLQEKERHRLMLMKHLYNSSNGDESKRVDLREAGKQMGIPDQEVQIALQWLCGEGLIVPFVTGVNYHITHQGVVEMEQLERQPARRTEHLAPMTVLINYGTISHSPIQAGNLRSEQSTTIDIQEG